jgi:hypothetical protein
MSWRGSCRGQLLWWEELSWSSPPRSRLWSESTRRWLGRRPKRHRKRSRRRPHRGPAERHTISSVTSYRDPGKGGGYGPARGCLALSLPPPPMTTMDARPGLSSAPPRGANASQLAAQTENDVPCAPVLWPTKESSTANVKPSNCFGGFDRENRTGHRL